MVVNVVEPLKSFLFIYICIHTRKGSMFLDTDRHNSRYFPFFFFKGKVYSLAGISISNT